MPGESSIYGGIHSSPASSTLHLSLPEYQRYGRQMILPSFGLAGQIKLRGAKALVVGAGGLGCPAVQYLAAAGVGHISIVDHDHVETSNLARQILHTDVKVGLNKAASALKAARIINPHISLEAIEDSLSAGNAVSLISTHDVVLDCTDNVMTRYLISDAAVLSGVQVVSGAAQGTEGQLVVLHKDMSEKSSASGQSRRRERQRVKRGPCYRCLFPKAPRPEDVTDCEDSGVLGAVTGLVGTMQAAEAIKLLVGLAEDEDEPPHLTLVTPFSYPPFRTVRLRQQDSASCRACGDPSRMSEGSRSAMIPEDLSEEDYVTFCGLGKAVSGMSSELLQAEAVSLAEAMKQDNALVIDVRPPVEFEIAHLPHAINLPFRELVSKPQVAYDRIISLQTATSKEEQGSVYLLCRKGNDSLLAQRALVETQNSERVITSPSFINVKGGLRAWSRDVDPLFPVY